MSKTTSIPEAILNAILAMLRGYFPNLSGESLQAALKAADNGGEESVSLPGKLLTVDEACERLSVSRPTIYRMMNEGRLRTVKIRGNRRIPESEVVRLART